MNNPKSINQQHPPLSKKERVDAKGNDRRRLFVKSGTATMLLADGLTKNACDILVQQIDTSVQKLGGNLKCSFLKFK